MSRDEEAARERSITVVGIVSALALFGDSMLYVVLPVYWKEAGLTSLWQVGVLLAANRFVRLPLNPLIGWLYRRMSLRTGLLAAVVLGAATTAGYGLWKGFAAWLVLRAVWGIAWSLMRMGGYLTVIECSDDSNRGRSDRRQRVGGFAAACRLRRHVDVRHRHELFGYRAFLRIIGREHGVGRRADRA